MFINDKLQREYHKPCGPPTPDSSHQESEVNCPPAPPPPPPPPPSSGGKKTTHYLFQPEQGGARPPPAPHPQKKEGNCPPPPPPPPHFPQLQRVESTDHLVSRKVTGRHPARTCWLPVTRKDRKNTGAYTAPIATQ